MRGIRTLVDAGLGKISWNVDAIIDLQALITCN